ncbi:metallophosphoesterase [Priestia filamentosa]|uniref:metallophosphoesterase family protein n=1 Tax=Priestia filamentosa TaxID=1402861 RepID=UPI00397BD89D
MNVAVYADIHSRELVFPNTRPEFVFLLGDIHWRDVKRIDQHFTKNYLMPVPCIGVVGNHDVLDTFNHTNIVNIHQRQIEINGVRFGGFGGSPKYNNKYNSGQYEEWEAEKHVRKVKEVDIFLAHSNPAFHISNDTADSHRGFLAFKKIIELGKTKYFFHGHIHENSLKEYKDVKVISTFGLREYTLSLEKR